MNENCYNRNDSILKAQIDHENCNQKPLHAYKKWSPLLDEKLLNLHKGGKTIAELCYLFSRTEGAIYARLSKLLIGSHWNSM